MQSLFRAGTGNNELHAIIKDIALEGADGRLASLMTTSKQA
jgi:hypothetical protein